MASTGLNTPGRRKYISPLSFGIWYLAKYLACLYQLASLLKCGQSKGGRILPGKGVPAATDRIGEDLLELSFSTMGTSI